MRQCDVGAVPGLWLVVRLAVLQRSVATVVLLLGLLPGVARAQQDYCITDADCSWMGSPAGEYCSEYQKCSMPKLGCRLGETGFKSCRPIGGFCPDCTNLETGPPEVFVTGRPLLLSDGAVAVALQVDGNPFWVYEVQASAGQLLTSSEGGAAIALTMGDSERLATAVLIAPPTADKVTLRFVKTTWERPSVEVIDVDVASLRRTATTARVSTTAATAQAFFRSTVGVRNVSAEATVVIVTATDANGIQTRRAAVVPAAGMVELPTRYFPAHMAASTSGTTTVEAGDAVLVPEGTTDCVVSLDRSAFGAPTRGAGVSFRVSATACPWTASSDAPWVSVSGGISGVDSGLVSYVVEPNPDQVARTAHVRVGSAMHVVTQEGLAPPPPVTTHTLYFAEGAVSSFFETRVAVFNPGASTATVSVHFTPAAGASLSRQITIPGRSRRTLGPSIVGLQEAEFSVEIRSDTRLVADRTMIWKRTPLDLGAHMETAIAAPSRQWYLAEGSTVGRFNLFYLLQNPHGREVAALVRYLLPGGAPLEKTYALPARSRTTIWVNQEEFPGLGRALASTDVSAVITSPEESPLIAERAMYLDSSRQAFVAGHSSAGVTAPAMEWFLAEGATGPFFDLFVLVANPTDTPADIEATYLLPNGTTLTKRHHVAANSRYNIWVDHEDPALANTAVSTTIRTTNGAGVIVERAMWWPGSAAEWYEAHNSAGATTTAARWVLAEGEVGGSRDTDTYVLIANTSPNQGRVSVTLFLENGATLVREFDVAGHSRMNVDVRTEFPDAEGHRFATEVVAIGLTPAALVVERAMYWSAGGQLWAAGGNALGTPMP